MKKKNKLFLMSIICLFLKISYAQQLDRNELAMKVVLSLQNSDINSLTKLIPTISEYENIIKTEQKFSKIKSKKNPIEVAELAYHEEFNNIKNRYNDLKGEYGLGKKNPVWNSVLINRILSEIENNNGNSFSAILVELIDISDDKKYYLEIDAVLTHLGWRIIDDIMIVDDNLEYRIKRNNKKAK